MGSWEFGSAECGVYVYGKTSGAVDSQASIGYDGLLVLIEYIEVKVGMVLVGFSRQQAYNNWIAGHDHATEATNQRLNSDRIIVGLPTQQFAERIRKRRRAVKNGARQPD